MVLSKTHERQSGTLRLWASTDMSVRTSFCFPKIFYHCLNHRNYFVYLSFRLSDKLHQRKVTQFLLCHQKRRSYNMQPTAICGLHDSCQISNIEPNWMTVIFSHSRWTLEETESSRKFRVCLRIGIIAAKQKYKKQKQKNTKILKWSQ